jgi:hypothetical protein
MLAASSSFPVPAVGWPPGRRALGELRERTRLALPVAAGLDLGILIGYVAGKPLGITSVTGTPTFFINGRRHYGSYDITALTSAVLAAKAAAAPAADPR